MNARLALGTLGLTLLLASCGQQQVSTPDTTGSSPARSQPGAAPVLGTSNPNAIPGQYIVVFSEGAQGNNLSGQSAGSLITSLGLDPQGVSIQYVYDQALNGFAGKLSAQNLATLRADKRVKYIEQDSTMYASATQSGATWGIDRIDQRTLPLSGTYTYTNTGAGVTSYIIDTGINTGHTNFGGRAVWGTNTTGDGQNIDCNGHGTHVAGTVGGSTWGVAKGTRLVAIKVLNCQGSGATSGIIAGINWAVNNKSGPAVANLSLGGGFSQANNDAVNNAANRGLIMAVAAGNEDQNACNVSPASAANAITVGSTTRTDARSSFSNWGSCVDISAPGSDITSTWIGSTSATKTISGTSMASPHVAGAVALILQSNPSATNSQVTSTLLSNATTGRITDTKGSPNRLLFTGAGNTTDPDTTTNYTGTVSSGASSYKPGSAGFSYAGGTLRGALSGPSGTDFDLFLQKLSGGTWTDVAASESGTSSESINYAATSGTYRWEVYAYSGSGSYALTETK